MTARKTCSLDTIHSEIAALMEAVLTMSQVQATAASDIAARLTRLENLPHLSQEDAVQIKKLVEYVPIITEDAKRRKAFQIVTAPLYKAALGILVLIVAVAAGWDQLARFVGWLFR